MFEIKEEIRTLTKTITKLKLTFSQQVRGCERQIDDCINTDTLKIFKTDLSDKIESDVNTLTKKCADKGETRRQMKNMEKSIKLYVDVHTAPKIEEEEDAIIAKKPHPGWACGSCERKLKKYNPSADPFLPWKGLPFKTPSERLSKVS